MPNFIDLHIHSTFSDGTLSPAALVIYAKKLELSAIALTDHDTVAGIEEAVNQGLTENIEVIPGIEVSARHLDNFVHILGYGFDHRDNKLLTSLAKYQEARQERNNKIIEKLNRLGINISIENLKRYACDQVGRPHFARELVRLGIVRSEEAAFTHFLRPGGKAFAESFRFSAEETITMIKSAGGVAVLAHPATIDTSLVTIPGLLRDLKNLGLTGLEVYYPKHQPKVCRRLEKMANDFDLAITGGSDFHGYHQKLPASTHNRLAKKIPYHLLEPLKKAMKSFEPQ